MIRSFGPLPRRGGRLVVTASGSGTLASLPARLHPRFDTETMSRDGPGQTMRDHAGAVRSAAAAGQGRPERINIPAKTGQVAAVRIYPKLPPVWRVILHLSSEDVVDTYVVCRH